jgi:glucose uptake protein GlcU
MNIVLLLILLGSLLTSLYVIIPKYAPAKQQDEISEWVSLGFNGLLFTIVLYETSFKYMNVYGGIAVLFIAIGVALSGIYWWIPTYIQKNRQTDVAKDMFTGLSIAILLTNVLTKSVPVTFNDMSGGRRR